MATKEMALDFTTITVAIPPGQRIEVTQVNSPEGLYATVVSPHSNIVEEVSLLVSALLNGSKPGGIVRGGSGPAARYYALISETTTHMDPKELKLTLEEKLKTVLSNRQ